MHVWYFWGVKRLAPDTDFPALIRQRRISLGMTQAGCCHASGVEASVWSRIERGESTRLTLRLALMMLKGVQWHINLTPDDTPDEEDDTPAAP